MGRGVEDGRHGLHAARPRGLGEARRALSVPERIRWTVEILGVEAGERILEVGCGSGVAAALVCERLVDGRMLAIDRSATQIAHAQRRNWMHLELGTLRLATADVASLEVEPGSFDAVFAVNVNAFWIGPATRELAIVKRALASGGRLVLVYETPTSARADEARERLEAVLVVERFSAPVVHRASSTLFACIAHIA